MCINNLLTRANDVALWQSTGLICTKFNLQVQGEEKMEGWEVIQRKVTRIKTNYHGFDSNRVKKKEKPFDILLKIITLICLNSIDFDTFIKEILDNKYS